MDASPSPDGIAALHNLAFDTLRDFFTRIIRASDPKLPGVPRMRMLGTQIVRVPHSVIWNQMMTVSFAKAKVLGYLGDMQCWGDVVMESENIGHMTSR